LSLAGRDSNRGTPVSCLGGIEAPCDADEFREAQDLPGHAAGVVLAQTFCEGAAGWVVLEHEAAELDASAVLNLEAIGLLDQAPGFSEGLDGAGHRSISSQRSRLTLLSPLPIPSIPHPVGAQMSHAIIRGKSGRRHEVDFADNPVRVKIYAIPRLIEDPKKSLPSLREEILLSA